MIVTNEQYVHIEKILKEDNIFVRDSLVFNEEEDDFVDDMSRIYVDGDISFDRIIEIADYLRQKS